MFNKRTPTKQTMVAGLTVRFRSSTEAQHTAFSFLTSLRLPGCSCVPETVTSCVRGSAEQKTVHNMCNPDYPGQSWTGGNPIFPALLCWIVSVLYASCSLYPCITYILDLRSKENAVILLTWKTNFRTNIFTMIQYTDVCNLCTKCDIWIPVGS